jgi:hypothetical protein
MGAGYIQVELSFSWFGTKSRWDETVLKIGDGIVKEKERKFSSSDSDCG